MATGDATPHRGPTTEQGTAPRPGPRIDTRAMTVAVGVPLLAAAAILGTNVWLGDRLGEVIATHWGADGAPAGYGGRTGFVVMMVLAGAVLPFAIMVAAGFARVWTALRRSLLGIGTWTAVGIAGLGVVSLVVQRDGAPGAFGLAPLWFMLAGVPVGVVASRVPRELVPPVLATTRPAAHLPRSSADGVPEHPIGLRSHLAVADDVLTVRWWRSTVLRVPVAEITEAHATTVSTWDWGGWGLRFQPGSGRYAYIGSGKHGVELHKADGTRWTVTTPRGEEVAGVINAAADRQR